MIELPLRLTTHSISLAGVWGRVKVLNDGVFLCLFLLVFLLRSEQNPALLSANRRSHTTRRHPRRAQTDSGRSP